MSRPYRNIRPAQSVNQLQQIDVNVSYMRGWGSRDVLLNRWRHASASSPEMRTTATPALPCAEDSA